MTTLIADSGATKTNWLLIPNNGKIEKYQTEGINPVVGDSTLISNTIGKSFAPYVEGTKIDKIIFLIKLKSFLNKKIIKNSKKNWSNEKYQFFLLFLP